MLFFLDKPAVLLGLLLAFVIGVYLGSAAQALTARALGDPMPMRAGWLKPSLKRQVSVFSAIAVLLAGWGWAEPVPMNDRWRARRFHVVTAVLTRPLVYALLCLAALGGVRATDVGVGTSLGTARLIDTTGGFGPDLLFAMATGFAALCVTALIPCPPTDLGRVIFTLGGQTMGWQRARYQLEERNFGVGIVLGLLLLPVLLSGFPSWVGQLAPQLIRGLSAILGVPVLT
ncbi:MAG TPA: Zn-dependent membrane protease [Frankiaceae bacterium]|nr:Zn-dependent membrane protease [Frankiaceae bacterium]